MLVRVTAAALIALTVMQLALFFVDSRFHDRPLPVLQCVFWTIPLVIGAVLLVKSKSIANWISDRFDQ